jgi:hypothetical protein
MRLLSIGSSPDFSPPSDHSTCDHRTRKYPVAFLPHYLRTADHRLADATVNGKVYWRQPAWMLIREDAAHCN